MVIIQDISKCLATQMVLDIYGPDGECTRMPPMMALSDECCLGYGWMVVLTGCRRPMTAAVHCCISLEALCLPGLLAGELADLLTGQLPRRCPRPGPDWPEAALGLWFGQHLLPRQLPGSCSLPEAHEAREEAAAAAAHCAEVAAALLMRWRPHDTVADDRGGGGSAGRPQQRRVVGAAERLLGICRENALRHL